MPSELLITIQDAGTPNAKVVALSGELDESNLDQIRTQLDPVLTDVSITKVLLDLTGLQFINSKGIGYIVSVHTHLSKDQRVLSMAAANEAVMDVISLVGLTSIIPYFATMDEALSSLNS